MTFKLPLFDFIYKMMSKKAEWKGLNPKARKITAALLTFGIYSLIATLFFAVAYNKVCQTEIFQILGLTSAFAWITLTFLAVLTNAAGAVLTKVEDYQRQKINFATPKCNKSVSLMQTPVLCVASYRAGNSRAHRSSSQSRSNASSGSSGDGESDSGEGNQGEPPLLSLSSLSLKHNLSFISPLCKLNKFLFPWRVVYVPGCWRMGVNSLFTERGYSL